MARHEIARGIVGLAIVALVGGCTSGSPSTPGRSATATNAPLAIPEATATSASTDTSAASPTIGFQEFHDSFCSAWQSLFDAVGNPDIGSGSDLTRAMDAAITAGDTASVDRLAGEITAELEAGRAAVAHATGWTPASPLMAEVDRLLVGFEAMTEAKRAAASQGLSVAKQLGQTALQNSGATDAWFALIRPGVLDDTRAAIDAARPRDVPTQCPNLPIGI